MLSAVSPLGSPSAVCSVGTQGHKQGGRKQQAELQRFQFLQPDFKKNPNASAAMCKTDSETKGCRTVKITKNQSIKVTQDNSMLPSVSAKVIKKVLM